MLNFDGDIDTNANADVKCEHTLSLNKALYKNVVQTWLNKAGCLK